MTNPQLYQAPRPHLDLAQHFMECGKMNANLTLAPGKRLVITEDLLERRVAPSALAMAAVAARDQVVARAALLPLSRLAARPSPEITERYERLFSLIEAQAFDPGTRDVASHMLARRFEDREIEALSHDLGQKAAPARQRYRAFVDTIRLMMAGKISQDAFIDEFVDFTRAVAGTLDFGIYAVCMQRLFGSVHIPLVIKAALVLEVLRYPPLIRRELLTDLFILPAAPAELLDFARKECAQALTPDQLKEILLFSTLKQSWASGRSSGRIH